MSNFRKISYFDMRHEIRHHRVPNIIGRDAELQRLSRILGRSLVPHVCLTGDRGNGITSLFYGAARMLAGNPQFQDYKIVLLDHSSLQHLGSAQYIHSGPYADAFVHMADTIILLDNFGSLLTASTAVMQNWSPVIESLTARKNIRLMVAMTREEHLWVSKNFPILIHQFETLNVSEQPKEDVLMIFKREFGKLAKKYGNFSAQSSTFEMLYAHIQRFPALGKQPKAGIQLLDEAIATTQTQSISLTESHPLMRHMQIRALQRQTREVLLQTLEQIISEKTGIPIQQLNPWEKVSLRKLPDILNRSIIGQRDSIDLISSVIQRAKLGLRSRNRPLASFLLLGPSGVGKTETAKILAKELYGAAGSFFRIDMSEFTEAHTVQRLIGAPPGYTGYDNGGQLTNHLKQHPYSLILLDEIEKAHPKIFDIFLQLLDDGRLTSGQGETVDGTQSIFMATSNLAVDEILSTYGSGREFHDQSAVKDIIFPVLLRSFRAEFLNRFDAIVPYKPLSQEALLDIAELEIRKIEGRVKQHNIRFNFDRVELAWQVKKFSDPRFGARPVKRFIEETCETMLAEQLLS